MSGFCARRPHSGDAGVEYGTYGFAPTGVYPTQPINNTIALIKRIAIFSIILMNV